MKKKKKNIWYHTCRPGMEPKLVKLYFLLQVKTPEIYPTLFGGTY